MTSFQNSAKLATMQRGQFRSKIKIVKNMQKNVSRNSLELLHAKAVPQNIYSNIRKMTRFRKTGHNAKPLARTLKHPRTVKLCSNPHILNTCVDAVIG